MPRSQSSRREVSGPGGVHAYIPMLAAARESTAVSSGSDSAAAVKPKGAVPPNLHFQRTIAHPPMQRSTSDHLLARRMKPWACNEMAQQNLLDPHRTAAAGGVKRLWGLAQQKALTVILRLPRPLVDGSLLVAEKPARVVTEGASLIPVRRERGAIAELLCLHTKNERINHPRPQLQHAGFPDTEDKDYG